MTSNYNRTKEWLGFAFNNIERVIRNYREKDYADCVFRIQLSIEQLQKALIFLLGLQFRKIHEPSKILESAMKNEITQNEDEIQEKIGKIVTIAKNIEKEGTFTRYGKIVDDKLITPEEKYDKGKTDEFLNDLKDILLILTDLLKEIPDIEKENVYLHKMITNIEDLEK